MSLFQQIRLNQLCKPPSCSTFISPTCLLRLTTVRNSFQLVMTQVFFAILLQHGVVECWLSGFGSWGGDNRLEQAIATFCLKILSAVVACIIAKFVHNFVSHSSYGYLDHFRQATPSLVKMHILHWIKRKYFSSYLKILLLKKCPLLNL